MHRLIQTALRIALGFIAAGPLSPTIAGAAGDGATVVVHRPEDFQFHVLLGPLDPSSSSGERSTTVRFPQAITLYRFRAELLDADGKPVGREHRWSLTIGFGLRLVETDTEARTLARLSSGFPDLSVPRPYGLQLGVGDSIRILAALPVDGAAGVTLRITMDYESSPATRLPALVLASQETTSTGVWTWRAEVSGRLVAIGGRQLAGAEELVVEDATTGRVIWQMREQYPVQGASEPHREAVRPGVAVREGRIYRLRIRYATRAAAEQPSGGDTPIAIVSPRRSAASDR